MIPTAQHSGKNKIMDTKKKKTQKSVVSGVGYKGTDKQAGYWEFSGW